jgi:uncharacterized membrane protein
MFKFMKAALVTGLLIVLPAWLAILLVLKVLLQLGVLVKPLSKEMPDGINHPQFVAAVVFIIVCLLVGLLVHTAVGRFLGKVFSDNIFNRIPGYQPLRSIARQFSDMEAKDGFSPALIEVEDGCLAPAFLIENHPTGKAPSSCLPYPHRWRAPSLSCQPSACIRWMFPSPP